MADFIITHRIEALELTAALNSLADALRTAPISVPSVSNREPSMTQLNPAQVEPEAPVTIPDATPTKVAPVQNVQTSNTAAPTVASPSAPTNAATTAPGPDNAITFSDITNAGSQLLDAGRMNDLMELLKGFGVQAITQLKPEQYETVAVGLRGLGAKI